MCDTIPITTAAIATEEIKVDMDKKGGAEKEVMETEEEDAEEDEEDEDEDEMEMDEEVGGEDQED